MSKYTTGEMAKLIKAELEEKEKQQQSISVVRDAIKRNVDITAESIKDIDTIMEDNKKLSRLHLSMLVFGTPATIILWGTIILWIVTGIWWTFVCGLPVVVAICCGITAHYFNNTEYICPECHIQFKPVFKEAFWANHTPKTRKLTCPKCKKKEWCVEVYAGKKK